MRGIAGGSGAVLGCTILVCGLFTPGCLPDRGSEPTVAGQSAERVILRGEGSGGATAGQRADESGEFSRLRKRMVTDQILARGIKTPDVLAAMGAVPRHLFVPTELAAAAYLDRPLPIGQGQTISQPYIVAFMTEQLNVHQGQKVLEIGTGSGYQAAVLARMDVDVFSIEIVAPLGRAAEARLDAMGYENIRVRIGDGYKGWPDEAPFDGIIVTAAPDHVPRPLLEQLRPGARLVIPVGTTNQELLVITRTRDGYHRERVLPVRFVPMTGEAESRPD